MNIFNSVNHRIAFQDGFSPVKILAGEHVFERLALQRTSIIFGITDMPWAAAAFRIDELIVQLEPNLDEWDAIVIEASGKAWLICHNTVVYELGCTILPDVAGLHSNFFYRCPECNRHIYECTHLLIGDWNRREPASPRAVSAEIVTCPECEGKVQSLAPGVSFCLDCDWERGLEPIS